MRSGILGLAMVVSLSLSFVLAVADEPQDPPEPYMAEGTDFGVSAIEYWGRCGYAGGEEVSFGFRTNSKDFNQACARKAFEELKAALDANPPEMAELAELGGPTWTYLILSDCTEIQQPMPARVWHYSADENGQGGLSKFHAVTRRAADGTVECLHPTREDFHAFVRAARDRIRRSAE